MIVYDPLWITMKNKGVTKYYLNKYCNINSQTLHKLKHNKPINITTVERLCEILDCNVEDIMTFDKDIKREY